MITSGDKLHKNTKIKCFQPCQTTIKKIFGCLLKLYWIKFPKLVFTDKVLLRFKLHILNIRSLEHFYLHKKYVDIATERREGSCAKS